VDPDQGSTALRLRLNPGQILLGVALLALLAGLFVTTRHDAEQHQRLSDFAANTETHATNVAFAMRDSLSHAGAVERWLAGGHPRRDWQITRALLAQRLSVRDTTGQRGGDAVPAEYRAALTTLDRTLAAAPGPPLTATQASRWAVRTGPALDEFAYAAGQLLTDFQQRADTAHRNLAADEATGEARLALLLFAALGTAFVLLAWIGVTIVRGHRRARAALRREEEELRRARALLARASELERGQSDILRDIASGTAAGRVNEGIVSLATRLTGLAAVLTTVDGTWQSGGAGTDVRGDVRWSRATPAGRDGLSHGQLALLGDEVDEAAVEVAERCLQLVTLVIERDQAASRLTHQATHDALTGLANRAALTTRIDELLDGTGTDTCVLFCDLDGFKPVNDTLGHKAGDRLLVEAAARLRAACRGSDLVARIGGDEFVVVGHGSERVGRLLADRVLAAFARPFDVEGAEVFLGVSVGLAVGGEGGSRSSAGLLRNADVAMYEAKHRSGGNAVAVFDARMQQAAADRLRLDSALHKAVDNGELRLSVQPIVRLADGRPMGAEALVRWVRPEYGETSPAEFIPIAEDNGRVVEIGRWVLGEALRWLRRRHLAGETELTVSVNVAARQLRDPEFEQDVLAALVSTGTDPRSLVLELTEGTLIEAGVAHEALGRLRALGVRVALDDFGTGYASFAQLRALPVDILKLDRSFLSPPPGDARDHDAVISAVARLAQALDLDLVVEGVETPQERERLLDLGCTRAQGFLFAAPIGTDDSCWDALAGRSHSPV
jgi:diguanylate cyclase (GGDEF)-like protein